MRRFFAAVLDETAPVSVLEVGSELLKVFLDALASLDFTLVSQ